MARVLTPHADGRVGPVEGVDVRVGLGYWPEDSVIARWDMARWDQPDALWAGAAPIEDISQHVITIRTSRGRDFPLERFRPGTATVVIDDPEGRYSPWNTAHDPSTYATVRPGVDLHVWTEHADDVYRLFAGAVNRIADDWEGADDDEHRVTFTAVDYLGELAAYDGLEQAPAGAGERAGARVNRVLDSAANPRARALDDGQVALQPTTLAKNALDEIGMVCDTELGAFLCMADGSLALLDRARLVSDIHFTDVQAVFGDEPGELCYVDLTLSSDTDKVKNVVSIANEGGAAITRTDPTSVSLYRPQTFRRFDLIHVDPAESIEIADEHLALFAYAANRIESLVVSPSVHDDVVPAVLALGLLYRIELRRRASGFQVVAQLQIQAIDHEIDADTWNITYKTFTARAVAHGGRWDRARWDVGLWGY